MDGEGATYKADFFLREVPSVKTSNTPAAFKSNAPKEELQFLRLTNEAQEQIVETLRYIHGPDFKFQDASAYEDTQANFSKKYWIGQGSLVIKGACDYSQFTEGPESEEERLKQFALLRLESYGFHKPHCIEALNYCSENMDDALYLLYHKYMNEGTDDEVDHNLSEKELLELREDEKCSLESIYEHSFHEKVPLKVWILKLKLDYLIKIFLKKDEKQERKQMPNSRKKEKCKYFIRGGCRFGNRCKFLHEADEPPPKDPNAHLNDYTFDLEIRFPENTKYPYEAPLIFLKTNAILPPLVTLHICKRLYAEARSHAAVGMSSVYSVTELLFRNEEEIIRHLETDIKFLEPHQRLFDDIPTRTEKPRRPSHYKKGTTNRDNKKSLTWKEIQTMDEKIVKKFDIAMQDKRYLEMLRNRRNLPAWSQMDEILHAIEKSQVVVVSGETGCGKSTQIPQFIFDDWLLNYPTNKNHIEIVCTQPRRISAIGVAERVAQERVGKIGSTVGYQIRLESKVSASTRLTFCTTGILLRRLEGEPTLPSVTHIIIDEVHERSEESDFLLLIVKELLPVRPDLKIILMSATLNAQLFSDYFGDIPMIDIPGRTFPVEQYFLEDVLETTGYVLEEGSEYTRKIRTDSDFVEVERSIKEGLNVDAPRNNIKDEHLTLTQISGRYPDCSTKTCKDIFMLDPEQINYDLIENVLTWIVSGNHSYPMEGTILVFLPGIAEITTLYDKLKTHEEFGMRHGKYWILPLHSSLSSEEQARIFEKTKGGVRKIVLSTNLAETSVTIDDCVFVIDSGKMKEKRFDPNRNMESLETVWVTRANALQRKGRAGRVMPGVCFHLYTGHRFRHHFLPQPVPEIHRIPLEQMILNIMTLPNFEDRDPANVLGSFIEPPVKENVDTAMARLQNVGALDEYKELTPLGHHLAALPVDVRIGKLILYGAIFSCVDAALTMAACLSHRSPFVTPMARKQEATIKKRTFAVGKSDQITALKAYEKWLTAYKRSSNAGYNFANENFLSQRTLTTIADIKHQFLEFLVDIGFVPVNLGGRRRPQGRDDVREISGNEFNRNGDNINVLSAILCAALYPNVVKVLTPPKSYVMTAGGAIPKEYNAKDLKYSTINERVFMHPSSVNYTVNSFPSPYLVYQEKVKTSQVFFRDCTMVPVTALVLFSGSKLIIKVHDGCTYISLEDGWIMFQVEEHRIAEMMKEMRKELLDLLEEKIKDPLLNLQHHDTGEKIISTILKLVSG